MTESLGKAPINCPHTRWQRVEGTEDDKGSYDAMCSDCGATKKTQPQRTEQAKDTRPRLEE